MAEPTSYTDVADAFDTDDPLDFHVHLGFTNFRTHGVIERERPAAGGLATPDVARFRHVQHVLDVGFDLGLYRDLALYGRLPVILSDRRSLAVPSGRTRAAAEGDLASPLPDGSSEPLFSVPFNSPTRSGLDHLALGLAWSLTNQHRSPSLPTWVLMVEGRLGVGKLLTACDADAAYEGDVRCNGGGSPGMSRGVHGLRVETRVSKRYRYVEPYGGLSFLVEWPGRARDRFLPGGRLDGYNERMPPRVGEVTAGMAVIPWEHRGRFQRFSLDLRGSAAYVSDGHDYSPLFDALGTSTSALLREPNPEGVGTGNESLRATRFFGLTDVEAHGRLGGRFALEMQAARYIRFRLGTGLFYTTRHTLTRGEACNTRVGTSASDPRAAGCATGIVDPHYRAVIDAPGNRFLFGGALTWDLAANAIAQF